MMMRSKDKTATIILKLFMDGSSSHGCGEVLLCCVPAGSIASLPLVRFVVMQRGCQARGGGDTLETSTIETTFRLELACRMGLGPARDCRTEVAHGKNLYRNRDCCIGFDNSTNPPRIAPL